MDEYEKEISDYRLKQRNRARLNRLKQRNRAHLRRAWELYSQFVLNGRDPRHALERVEAAMEVWGRYEDRVYLTPDAGATVHVTQPVSKPELETEYPAKLVMGCEIPCREAPKEVVEPILTAQADLPPPPPKPSFDFTGRWITRGGHSVKVIATPKARYPYDTGVGSEAPGLGVFWDASGLAVSAETQKPTPEYDLIERAPSPGGHRMDYLPELIPKED